VIRTDFWTYGATHKTAHTTDVKRSSRGIAAVGYVEGAISELGAWHSAGLDAYISFVMP
jgi:hypothetical protein